MKVKFIEITIIIIIIDKTFYLFFCIVIQVTIIDIRYKRFWFLCLKEMINKRKIANPNQLCQMSIQ